MQGHLESPSLPIDAHERLERLRARRLAESDRMVCLERARILDRARTRHVALNHTARQAAVLRDLCQGISTPIEQDDILMGRMPETMPTDEDERFIAAHPDLFSEPGCPGLLDSMSIYIPDWQWLFEVGLRGIAHEITERLTSPDTDEGAHDRREFREACLSGLESISELCHRYARAARDAATREESPQRHDELEKAAARCARLAWDPPDSFVDALQLLQIVHMVLSCLVGGRDVTPGRLDQALWKHYRSDVDAGRLTRDEAVSLLAMCFLRMSQMGGHASDFDPGVRRTPCQFTHLYVTVGGVDRNGRCAVNDLSYAIADAIRLLNYKEPTLLVRYRLDMPSDFKRIVGELVRDRYPVTIYHDNAVIGALVNNGVALEDARDYAHSACHNVLLPGCDAATGIGGYHNVPALLIEAMRKSAEGNGDTGLDSFDAMWEAFRLKIRAHLARARQGAEERWRNQLRDACPLPQSLFMRHAVLSGQPAWQSARYSHLNHYLVGLATVVDSLLAVKGLAFEEHMPWQDRNGILTRNWTGHEPLRHRILTRLPRYGDGSEASREMAHAVCRLWNEETRRASKGLTRLAMWPGFYSHLIHTKLGNETPSTPDGRYDGEPLSENMSPSFAGSGQSGAPTDMLLEIAGLPLPHTASGASSLMLNRADMADETGLANLLSLIESFFESGGLHLHISCVDARVLEEAQTDPENHRSLMVRVAGFSAYFTQLQPDVQTDIIQRYRRDSGN